MKDVTTTKGLSELRTATTSRLHSKPAKKGTAHLDLYLLSMERQRLETELARLEKRRRRIHEHLAEIRRAMDALLQAAEQEGSSQAHFTGLEAEEGQPVPASSPNKRQWKRMTLDY